MIIDVNVTLSRWPFRRLPFDDPAALVSKLRSSGVSEAWAASFDALLHKDLAASNTRLAADCERYGPGFLLPFGTVNPKSPDWQEDLRRCYEQHRMRGLRLYPNYHQYTLDDPSFAELLSLAARRGLLVQIALAMEDERTQHPLLRVPPVNPAPLAQIASAMPGLRLVILNHNRLAPAAIPAAASLDIAMVEGVGGVGRFVASFSSSRVLFGSHFPFFLLESALLKVRESALPAAQENDLLASNARRLLPL
ncbi:MAG TPA: amidohydrolase family protein [Bryobacterales bacterium]|nr:amidohydrolase family protein [Bryobacterales bacterium]